MWNNSNLKNKYIKNKLAWTKCYWYFHRANQKSCWSKWFLYELDKTLIWKFLPVASSRNAVQSWPKRENQIPSPCRGDCSGPSQFDLLKKHNPQTMSGPSLNKGKLGRPIKTFTLNYQKTSLQNFVSLDTKHLLYIYIYKYITVLLVNFVYP